MLFLNLHSKPNPADIAGNPAMASHVMSLPEKPEMSVGPSHVMALPEITYLSVGTRHVVSLPDNIGNPAGTSHVMSLPENPEEKSKD